MEQHPDYAQTVANIEARGYKVVRTQSDPCVVIREVVDGQGNVLREEREVQVRPGMAFLDLEHEIGHLDQIENQLKGAMLPTERILASGRRLPDDESIYAAWKNKISEYHNCLVEYLRLHTRGVDADVLEYHAQKVRAARNNYQKIVLNARRALRADSKRSSNLERLQWGQKHFPDIDALEAEYQENGGYQNERDLR